MQSLTFEEDKHLLLYIVKNIIFKHGSLQSYWEEVDINWAENRAILKSMVVKTIKTLSEEGLDAEPQLVELSSNWEEDKDFFIRLFSNSIKFDHQYEALVSKKAKNWDVETHSSIRQGYS